MACSCTGIYPPAICKQSHLTVLFLVIYNAGSTESPAQVLILALPMAQISQDNSGAFGPLFFSVNFEKMDFGLPWIGTRFQNNQKSNSYQP